MVAPQSDMMSAELINVGQASRKRKLTALEAVLALDDIVENLVVLACVGAVDRVWKEVLSARLERDMRIYSL